MKENYFTKFTLVLVNTLQKNKIIAFCLLFKHRVFEISVKLNGAKLWFPLKVTCKETKLKVCVFQIIVIPQHSIQVLDVREVDLKY